MSMNPRLLRPLATIDPDAAAWRSAVTAAGSSVSGGVVDAVSRFIKGCKSDGIWDAMKSVVLLAGADTLAGALAPLKGTAPTSYNFVSGDYSATSGLVGNGSTKYLDANRATNADPQNSMHIAVYPTDIGTTTLRASGSYEAGGSDETLIFNGDVRCRTIDTVSNVSVAADSLYGVSRSSSTTWYARGSGSNVAGGVGSSVAPNTRNHFIFGYNNAGSLFGASNARLSFYSIGESLDLSLLDARVSALMTDLGVS